MGRLFAILAATVVLIILLVHLIKQYRYSRMVQLRVRKLYASPVYEAMQPLLKAAQHRQLERLSIDKTGVLFQYLIPSGSRSAFLMKNHGFAYLTPEQQDAMRALLEQCLPKLRDHTRYQLSKKKHRLLNGDVEYSYSYVMANSYKITLTRATYYDPKLQARLR